MDKFNTALNNDKNNFYPDFIFLREVKNYDFNLVLLYNTNIDSSILIIDLINNFEKHEIKNRSFYYYTKENCYIFDLKEHINLIPINIEFSHFVSYFDKNDNIINSEYNILSIFFGLNN